MGQKKRNPVFHLRKRMMKKKSINKMTIQDHASTLMSLQSNTSRMTRRNNSNNFSCGSESSIALKGVAKESTCSIDSGAKSNNCSSVLYEASSIQTVDEIDPLIFTEKEFNHEKHESIVPLSLRNKEENIKMEKVIEDSDNSKQKILQKNDELDTSIKQITSFSRSAYMYQITPGRLKQKIATTAGAMTLKTITSTILWYLEEMTVKRSDFSYCPESGNKNIHPFPVNVSELCGLLATNRRRLYDVAHVMEGAGILEKGSDPDHPRQLRYIGETALKSLLIMKKKRIELLEREASKITSPALQEEWVKAVENLIIKDSGQRGAKMSALGAFTENVISITMISVYKNKYLTFSDIAEKISKAGEAYEINERSTFRGARGVGRRVYDCVTILLECNILCHGVKKRGPKRVAFNYSLIDDMFKEDENFDYYESDISEILLNSEDETILRCDSQKEYPRLKISTELSTENCCPSTRDDPIMTGSDSTLSKKSSISLKNNNFVEFKLEASIVKSLETWMDDINDICVADDDYSTVQSFTSLHFASLDDYESGLSFYNLNSECGKSAQMVNLWKCVEEDGLELVNL